MADVNWLLSAMMQSGAALVAILGGALGARYVGLHSEYVGQRRELESAESRRDDALNNLSAAQIDATNAAVDVSKFYNVVRLENLPDEATHEETRRAISAEFADDEVTRNQALASLESSIAISRRAKRQVESMWNDLVEPRDWQEARDDIPAAQEDDLIARHAYLHRMYQGRGARPELIEKHIRERDSVRSLMIAKYKKAKEDQYEADGALQDARDEYAGSMTEADERREVMGVLLKGEGFALSLKVLGLMSLLMIVPSAVLLGFGVKEIALVGRLVLVIGFLVALAFLFVFLAAYALYLSGSIRELPTGMGDLVRAATSRSAAAPRDPDATKLKPTHDSSEARRLIVVLLGIAVLVALTYVSAWR